MFYKRLISTFTAAALAALAAVSPMCASAKQELKGDMNNSGALESEDALIVLRYSTGMGDLGVVSESIADINDDGSVDSADALDILRVSVGLADINDKGEDHMISEEVYSLSLPYYDSTNRKVRVYVPEHEEGETFPVIYMTDGQNLFEDDTVQYGCWYTREAVRAERESGGKGAIIVGIHNDTDPQQRANELTPESIGAIDFPDDMPQEERDRHIALGEKFDDFLINTVMPTVEKQFPVKTGRENTAFCGSSSGGLESYYIALSHPDKFSAAGVFSPVFMMYKKDDLESWIRTTSSSIDNAPFIYMYVGGEAGMEEALKTDVEWVSGIMEECYPSQQLKTVIKPDQPHHESAWEVEFKEFLHIFLS